MAARDVDEPDFSAIVEHYKLAVLLPRPCSPVWQVFYAPQVGITGSRRSSGSLLTEVVIRHVGGRGTLALFWGRFVVNAGKIWSARRSAWSFVAFAPASFVSWSRSFQRRGGLWAAQERRGVSQAD